MTREPYIISMVGIKQIPTGQNIQNVVRVLPAMSKTEARGLGIEVLTNEFPEHTLFTIIVVRLSDTFVEPYTIEPTGTLMPTEPEYQI